MAADADGNMQLPDVDVKADHVFVIGNEGGGVSEPVREVCDATVSIPQFGSVSSLNAAQAATLICYEMRRSGADPSNQS